MKKNPHLNLNLSSIMPSASHYVKSVLCIRIQATILQINLRIIFSLVFPKFERMRVDGRPIMEIKLQSGRFNDNSSRVI